MYMRLRIKRLLYSERPSRNWAQVGGGKRLQAPSRLGRCRWAVGAIPQRSVYDRPVVDLLWSSPETFSELSASRPGFVTARVLPKALLA